MSTPVKTREELFREKAGSYIVCYSQGCPLREHCLRNILKDYVPEQRFVVNSVNLTNPQMQREGCPHYRNDQPRRMPVGLTHTYYDMPGHTAKEIKSSLISTFSRKRYYEYHNGSRPITPDIEKIIRKAIKANGWESEPVFDSYTEDYIW